MTTSKPEIQQETSWIKSNVFSIVNLLLIVTTFAYQYGASTNELINTKAKNAAAELRLTAAEVKINDLQRISSDLTGHEARLIALEKKTDDLAVLKNIVQTQSESIRQLTDTVKSDHDILLRYVTAAETKHN